MRALAFASLIIAAIVSTVLADNSTPARDLDKDIVKIAYGQQLQDKDEANHWVAWIEGKKACSGRLQVLGRLIDAPCNQEFNLSKSANLTFADCNPSSLEPNALFSNGKFVRSCKPSKNKKTIKCHHNGHNIIKHGKCT
jgi:hypothetical protein